MRTGKINTFPRSQDIDSLLSNVPIPDNVNYTTVFKSAITGYYYERLSTGQINKITCCKNELSFVVNVKQIGVAAPTAVLVVNDFTTPAPARVAMGIYHIAFGGAPFNVLSSTVEIQQPSPAVGFVSASVKNAQTIEILTFNNAFVASDNILGGQTLRVTA